MTRLLYGLGAGLALLAFFLAGALTCLVLTP
jgi:hypothetical protein